MQVKTCMWWLFLHYSCFLSPHLFALCFFMLACFAFPGLLSPISCQQDILLWNVCAKDDLTGMIRSTSLVGLCSSSRSQGFFFISKVKRSKGKSGGPPDVLPEWVTKNICSISLTWVVFVDGARKTISGEKLHKTNRRTLKEQCNMFCLRRNWILIILLKKYMAKLLN